MTDRIREIERSKYERIWALPSYRVNSPGRNIAPHAVNVLQPATGSSIMDYGCGEAKAVDFFNLRGLKASGCDLVPLRADVHEVCLWDIPETVPVYDYAFCADVMEHIPPRLVEAVLNNIRFRTRIAGYFQIATAPDVHGDKIGETLHLTVENRDWWAERLRQHFTDVQIEDADKPWRFGAICRV